jgi:hypothetical protein
MSCPVTRRTIVRRATPYHDNDHAENHHGAACFKICQFCGHEKIIKKSEIKKPP